MKKALIALLLIAALALPMTACAETEEPLTEIKLPIRMVTDLVSPVPLSFIAQGLNVNIVWNRTDNTVQVEYSLP